MKGCEIERETIREIRRRKEKGSGGAEFQKNEEGIVKQTERERTKKRLKKKLYRV